MKTKSRQIDNIKYKVIKDPIPDDEIEAHVLRFTETTPIFSDTYPTFGVQCASCDYTETALSDDFLSFYQLWHDLWLLGYVGDLNE